MATPTPNEPKKPAQPGQPAKPIQPGAGGAKPQPKPAAKKKPAARTLGVILVDLGFIDDGQLASIEEEARQTDTPVERIALDRGLINEDQLLQATAELHGMQVVNLEDVKPAPEALKV